MLQRNFDPLIVSLADFPLGDYRLVLMNEEKQRFAQTAVFSHGGSLTWSPTPPPVASSYSHPELAILLPLVIAAPVLLIVVEIVRWRRAKA